MQRARLAAVAALMAVGIVVLSGCGQARPGTAALVDGARYTVAEVERIVDEHFDAMVSAATAQFGAEAVEPRRAELRAAANGRQQEVLGLLVVERVARRVAEERGVAVPTPDYEQAAAEYRLVPGTRLARLRADVESVAAALRERLDPVVATDQDFTSVDEELRQVTGLTEQDRASILAALRSDEELRRIIALRRALADAFDRYGVEVNPRYAGVVIAVGGFPVALPSESAVERSAA